MNLKAVSSFLAPRRDLKPVRWTVILNPIKSELTKREAVEKIVELFPVSYDEAHELVERTPIILLEDLSRERAQSVRSFFDRSGVSTVVTDDELLKRKCYRTVWPEKPRLEILEAEELKTEGEDDPLDLKRDLPVHEVGQDMKQGEDLASAAARVLRSQGIEPAGPSWAVDDAGREREALAKQVEQLKQESASLRLLRDIAKAPRVPREEDEALRGRLDALNEESALLKARVEELEKDLEAERMSRRAREEERRLLSAEAARLKMELARVSEERSLAGEMQQKVAELEASVASLKRDRATLMEERARLAKQVDALSLELEESARLRKEEAGALGAEVEKLTSQNETLAESLRDKEGLEERVGILARDLEAAQRQIRDLTVHREQQEAVQKRLRLQNEVAEKESALRELVRRQEVLEQEVLEREKAMKDVLREQEELEKEIVRSKQAQKYLLEQSKWRDRSRLGAKRPSGVQIQAPGEGLEEPSVAGPEPLG